MSMYRPFRNILGLAESWIDSKRISAALVEKGFAIIVSANYVGHQIFSDMAAEIDYVFSDWTMLCPYEIPEAWYFFQNEADALMARMLLE